jgi:hypothetical protein
MNYEIDMKNYRRRAGPAMLTPVAAGRLKIPTALTTGADAPNQKVTDAKAEAVEFKGRV